MRYIIEDEDEKTKIVMIDELPEIGKELRRRAISLIQILFGYAHGRGDGHGHGHEFGVPRTGFV